MYIQHEKGLALWNSYDKKNQEIAPMMMTQWWYRSSHYDPDPVMMIQQDGLAVMIQIEWWSRSRWRWLEYQDNLKMKMTWRWTWQELIDDSDDTEKKTHADKLCWENTFLVKRECWCICNFRMYSPVYLMSCTLMFIPRSVCNVFESCHAPMFL